MLTIVRFARQCLLSTAAMSYRDGWRAQIGTVQANYQDNLCASISIR